MSEDFADVTLVSDDTKKRNNDFMSVVNNLEIKDLSKGVESNDSLTDNTYDVTTNIRGIGREF